MKIKTADLIGPALNWAVAKALGLTIDNLLKTLLPFAGVDDKRAQFNGIKVEVTQDWEGLHAEWMPLN